jgi:hypothetical protein
LISARHRSSTCPRSSGRCDAPLFISTPCLNGRLTSAHLQAWIDFEFSQQERERTRSLYETLLSKTGHVKVWIAYALFEVQPMVDEETGEEVEGEGGDPDLARKVLQRGYDALRKEGLKEERVVLLEAWKEFEAFHGEDADREKVEGMMPRVVKKWRKTDDGANALEECTSGRILGRSSRLERRLTFLTLLPRAQTGT